MSILLLGAITVVPASGRLASFSTHGVILALLVVASALALQSRRWDASHIAVVSTLYLAAYCLPVVGVLWPLPLVVMLAAYGTFVAFVPAARRTVRYWHRGTLDRGTVGWMVAFTLMAGTALITWRFASGVDMAPYRRVVPPGVPTWAVLAGIVPFAMFNAAVEELIWRGVVWQACEAAFGTRAALVLSTLSFGLAHYRGFPSGLLGVILASIYGLMMGIVRIRSRGLLGPWLAHVFADVVIFTMVAILVLA